MEPSQPERHGVRQRLALIELTERDGRHVRAFDVQAWPLSMGRALDNDLVIDDPHIAAHHAVVEADGQGRLQLRVLDTRNGVLMETETRKGAELESHHLAAQQVQALPEAGALLQLGGTQLRLRLPGEVLAAEKPLPGLGRGGKALPLLAALGIAAIEYGGHWITLDPGADYAAWLPTLVGLPVAAMLWCAGWALLSKLFRHRFEFSGHLHLMLPWVLAIGLVGALWPQATAALDAPALWQLSTPLQALLLALLVRSHMLLALPMHPRTVSATVAAFVLTAGGILLANTWRATDSLSGAPYMSTLPLPALRLGGSVPQATLVRDMAPLEARLAQRAKKAREEDRDDGNAPGEE